MGYPMTYSRVIDRNDLRGGGDGAGSVYATPKRERDIGSIIGDLRRLELDQLDAHHLRMYAMHANCTEEQARKVLEMFFFDEYSGIGWEAWCESQGLGDDEPQEEFDARLRASLLYYGSSR